ncbi:hypothetical protein Esti_002840 [Eimeria stiedai]
MSLGLVDSLGVSRALASGPTDQDDDSDEEASKLLESCLQMEIELRKGRETEATHLYARQEARSALPGDTAAPGISLAAHNVWPFGPEEQAHGDESRMPHKKRSRKQSTGQKERPKERDTVSRRKKVDRRGIGAPASSLVPQAQRAHTALASLLLALQSESSMGADDAGEPSSAGERDGSPMPSTSIEAGRQPTGEQHVSVADSVSTPGFVILRLYSGTVCRIPHPPPPMPATTHLYYRLPRVAAGSIQHLFCQQAAMVAGSSSRSIRRRLYDTAFLLAKEELNETDVSHLMQSLETILRYLMRIHTNDVNAVNLNRAPDVLGMRFLCFDMLVSGIHILGPAKLPEHWFPALVESVLSR